jgi:uncharacterized membrane protein YebE (DUF533 family)
MINPEKILQQILGGGDDQSKYSKGGSSSGLLKGAALGGLASMLLGSKAGRKMGGSALKMGGMAALGGLAYNAWRNYQAQQQGKSVNGQASAEDTVFLPKEEAERSDLGLTLIGAMIAAAKADGHIDGDEEARIYARVDSSELSPDEKGFLMDQLRKPPTIDELAAKATSPERAVEIYAASLLAIDPDQQAEQNYLNNLAARLNIVPALKRSVEAEVRTTG